MLKIKVLSVMFLAAIAMQTASAELKTLQNCSQLKAPKSVLLVHASWCSHCRAYKPVYQSVANLSSMKDYTFYIKQNNNLEPVCGVSVGAVPVTFTQNMQARHIGKMSQHQLVNYVKTQ